MKKNSGDYFCKILRRKYFSTFRINIYIPSFVIWFWKSTPEAVDVVCFLLLFGNKKQIEFPYFRLIGRKADILSWFNKRFIFLLACISSDSYQVNCSGFFLFINRKKKDPYVSFLNGFHSWIWTSIIITGWILNAK